jgi:ABC-2 type transport system permease protein
MPSQLAPLLRNEITKASRRKLPYFGIIAIGVLCVAVYFVAAGASSSARVNAWGYVGFSMQLVFADIGPIMIVAFSSLLIAEETGSGTIRAALAAPVHRWEVYLAKVMMGLLYMIVLSVTALLFSMALARVNYSFGAVSDAFGVIHSRPQATQQFVLAYALSWIPLSALVMYGILISTLIRSPGAAVATGVSVFFLVDFTKHLVGLDPYLFTKYIAHSWVVLQQAAEGMDYQWQPEVWRMASLSGLYLVIAFAVGLVIFTRQDLNH